MTLEEVDVKIDKTFLIYEKMLKVLHNEVDEPNGELMAFIDATKLMLSQIQEAIKLHLKAEE